MIAPRICAACLWGATALFALYEGIAHGSAWAWWLLAVLVPPLIVFLWWMADRAALERRIRRLEARSEIGYERRVVAIADLSKVQHRLHEVETRVTQVEDHEDDAARSEAHPSEQISGRGSGPTGGVISINPK